MVHVANRIEQLRPVAVREALTATTWARNLVSRPVGERMGAQVDLVTEVRSGPELVWQGVSTYLARSTQISGLPVLERVEHGAFAAPSPTGGWSTSLADSKAYAAVSGDRNPIHTSRLAARGFGYRSTIAHGMDTAARALAALGPVRGDAFTWTVEFASPVLVPGRVALAVERRDDVDTSGGVRGGYALTVWDPKRGKPHLTSVLAHA
ncbi:MaoC/PaaZ C-terminal domain-containing protein [Litorihabitans aurantiacus]|nr:MaoC/PaaZ C-terminal domain-containing protein [Litorihabitans aurantiacus]